MGMFPRCLWVCFPEGLVSLEGLFPSGLVSQELGGCVSLEGLVPWLSGALSLVIILVAAPYGAYTCWWFCKMF